MFNLLEPAQLIPLFFALSIFPIAIIMLTSFSKIVIVLSLLKTAMGLQQVPPAMVINGLALVLTWYVMYPVGQEVFTAVENHQANGKGATTVSAMVVFEKGKEPVREFLLKHANERERFFFMDASFRLMGEKVSKTITDKDFVVLVPAFVLSQLTEAFTIGVMIALPFLVIDLVVANILMALGMQMISPAMISLPVKMLLFVVLDGWSRLAHALVLTYR